MLEAPQGIYAPGGGRAATSRRTRQPDPGPRRDFGEDFAGSLPDVREEAGFDHRRRRETGFRIRFRGRILELPGTLWGRLFTGFGLLLLAGCFAGGLIALRNFFLHDSRFTIASSSSIQIAGNTHVTRAQLLSVFGEDVERNIFSLSLAERRAELETLPWVAHATVMRLLPNHIQIDIVERTPAAFVRQGSRIGMVDASGVLLDMPPDAPGDPHYSFPVVTGINANDPASTRVARMKIYIEFADQLDSAGNRNSEKLSEVDLSNPEDIMALVQEGPSDILVHFGDSDFLARLQKFEQFLPEWRSQHPNLASVDMRYERQVVLEMKPGTLVAAAGNVSGKSVAAAAPATSGIPHAAAVPPARNAAKPGKPATATIKKPVADTRDGLVQGASGPDPAAPASTTSEEWHMVVVKPHTKGAAAVRAGTTHHSLQAAPK